MPLQIATTSLIFLYGLPSGTLNYHKDRLEFAYNSLVFILSLALFTLFTNFLSLAAGALITLLVFTLYKDYVKPHWTRTRK